ncbi:AN1-type zinc finger domain-containing protein [Halobaculum sp. EA56]|uniref:AN1-type zinc finger domain-containing protein n=1 Tax=Halobaculum sp. EA56 TaxID=3421648 RepID=UPI003EBF3F68
MTTCDRCGAALEAPRRCSYCDGVLCSEHRLPERHDCPGVSGWGSLGGRFDSGFDGLSE